MTAFLKSDQDFFMNKTAFVFPGQGSQKTGMLSALALQHAEVEATFSEASDILSLDLWKIISENPNDLLDQTHITQPALLAASVAIWRLWTRAGNPLPALLAGHSLGEYSALTCAGVLSFEDAVRLVHRRGLYMQEAVPAGTGAMAAILGLDDARIEEICAQVALGSVVSPANFNSTGQTVIAGEKAAVERAMQACRDAGAKRALPLNVSVPSHCALMKSAAGKLAGDLNQVVFHEAAIPVVQNVDGCVAADTDQIKQNLLSQLYLPVQWVKSIGNIRGQGHAIFIECGPGKILGGLIKRIEPQVKTYSTEEPDSFSEAAAAAS